MSVESDESIPREGLMADARRVGRVEEFLGLTPVLIRWIGLQMS